MVSRFTQKYSTASPMPPTILANRAVSVEVICPSGKGRARVRAMAESMRCSTKQFIAAAAPATSAIPSVPARNGVRGTMPGTASSMPMTAQKTINELTRGLVSW